MANFVKWLLEKNNKELFKIKRLVFSDSEGNSDTWVVKHLALIMILANTVVFVFLAAMAVFLLPVFILMCILNAPYAFYLWVLELPYFKNKYIKKELLIYEAKLNKEVFYDLRSSPTLILVHVPTTCELFLRKFFTEYNNKYYTYGICTDELICDRSRRRTVHDLYLICKGYYSDVTLNDVLKILIGFVNEGFIGVSKCGDINKYVFKLKDNYTGIYTDRELDFVNGINFKQLMKYYE